MKYYNFYLENFQTKISFAFTSANLVVEKFEKINKEYTLLNPPLGKG